MLFGLTATEQNYFQMAYPGSKYKKTKQLHAARYTDKTRSFLGTAGIIAAIFVGKKKYCTNCEHVLAAFVAMKLKPKRDLCGFCAKT